MDSMTLRDAISLLSLLFSQAAIVLAVVAVFYAKSKGRQEAIPSDILEVDEEEEKVRVALAPRAPEESFDDLERRFNEMMG
jgi:hypothetical protein